MTNGIICNWWRKVGLLPAAEIPERLTARNLDWHQNRYGDPDPLEGGEPFGRHSPFISVTAGTVQRDAARKRNFVTPAREIALQFATDFWQADGWIFHCYVFVLGQQAIAHTPFAEELRELNVYQGFSLYQPEGEITAKISIPPPQIQSCDFYEILKVRADLATGTIPTPSKSLTNPLYEPAENISNMRDLLL